MCKKISDFVEDGFPKVTYHDLNFLDKGGFCIFSALMSDSNRPRFFLEEGQQHNFLPTGLMLQSTVLTARET